MRVKNGEFENNNEKKVVVERLRKNIHFKKVYRHGKSLATNNIVLFFKKNGDDKNYLGISINKKVGNSVQRHRLKRIYKEAFKKIKGNIEEGYDFIIVARRGAGLISFHEAVQDLLKLLSRGKLLR